MPLALSATDTLKSSIRNIVKMQTALKLKNNSAIFGPHHYVASFRYFLRFNVSDNHGPYGMRTLCLRGSGTSGCSWAVRGFSQRLVSYRFLVSTPRKKDGHHISWHTKYQAVLRWNRSSHPFRVKCNYNIFKGSNSWSKRISRSCFGQNSDNVKKFRQVPRHSRLKAGQNIDTLVKWTKTVVFRLMKVLATFWLIISLVIIAAPSLLSSSIGLHAVMDLTNKVIPGKASIKSMSVGWTKPVSIEGILIQGADGEPVLIIPKIETKAPLWSLITGRAGFGNCTITSPVIDLQEEKGIGILRLALAVIPREKIKHLRKRRVSRGKVVVPLAHVDLIVNVNAPGGNLQVTNGKLILPEDLAAVIGQRLFVDMLLGHFATQHSQEFESDDFNGSLLPLHMGLWSECAEARASGFLDASKMQIQLIRPIKVEMDLTPAVGCFYLRRINPLLGEVLGPAIENEDMPDMIVYISPRNLIFPTAHWKVHIEPMKAVLARGPLAGGILSLLSKANTNIALGRKEIRVETSAIKADFDIGGSLTCARVDLLLAGAIHVATWGMIDLIEETIEMTLAIPDVTLKDVMGLSNLPKNYYLKIPIRGTFDQPQVDWKIASFNIVQLALRQRSDQFMRKLLEGVSPPEEPIPEPSGSLPWKSDSNRR